MGTSVIPWFEDVVKRTTTDSKVGRCGLTLSNPRRKRLEVSALNYNVLNRFQTLLSISTYAATPR